MRAIARFKHIHRLWRVNIFRRESWIRRIPYPQSFQWRSRLLPHLILRLLQPRSKIIWSEPHTFTYLLPRAKELGGTFNVFTKAIYLQNVGKQSASDVQVICNYEPQYYNLWPPLPHETETMDDKRFVIRANSLGPKEWFQIEILSEELLPNVLRVLNFHWRRWKTRRGKSDADIFENLPSVCSFAPVPWSVFSHLPHIRGDHIGNIWLGCPSVMICNMPQRSEFSLRVISGSVNLSFFWSHTMVKQSENIFF